MKSLNIVVAAFAGVTAARSVLTARQDNKVTAEETCDWFETGRHNSAKKVDPICRSAAEKCIQDQSQNGGFDQLERAKEDINLCAFSPMIGSPTTDFLTVCNELDITPEACHSHTSWCVMDDATFTKGKEDKNAAPDRILACVSGRILNKDGDTLKNFVASRRRYNNDMICSKKDTTVECKATVQGQLGQAICKERIQREDTPEDQWEKEREEIKACKEEFDRNTPATDILDVKQLGQYCQGQGVECSKCRLYLKGGPGEGTSGLFDPYVRYVECQTGSSTPQANAPPAQSPKSVDEQLQDHCGRPGNDKDACMSAARRCTGQVKPDATAQVFLECVDRMQICGGEEFLFNVDRCIDSAKACKAQENSPLGDLAKLGQCVKKGL